MNRNEILKPFAEKLGISIDDLISKKRNHHLTDARKIICNDLRKKGLTLHEIGFILKKDHTTVIYNIRAYKDYYQFNPKFKKLANKTNE